MRLVFDRKALSDIENIYRWISRDSPDAAAKIVERLYASIEGLVDFPYSGRSGGDPGTQEWVVTKLPYVVVYEIRHFSNELRVLSVFHQAQDRTKDGLK
jgi:addiction module RelE/StbE family toxin